MSREYERTLERISSLKPNQRWAFQVFRYVQEKFHSGRNDDLNIDVIQGIPEKFLESDVALGIATVAAELSLVTHLGFIRKNGKLIEISTPEEKWFAVQKQMWNQIWSPHYDVKCWFLRPFFEAHLAERPDIKLHLPANKFPEDVFFEKWHPDHMSKERLKEGWEELMALGIVRPNWYVGGAENAHYELNPTFFAAFREGLDESSTRTLSWKNDPEALKHSLYYLSEKPEQYNSKK